MNRLKSFETKPPKRLAIRHGAGLRDLESCEIVRKEERYAYL